VWASPASGAAVLLPGSSGSSGGLPGEFSSTSPRTLPCYMPSPHKYERHGSAIAIVTQSIPPHATTTASCHRLVPPHGTTTTRPRPRRVLTHLVPPYAMTMVAPRPHLFLTHLVLIHIVFVHPSTHDDDDPPSRRCHPPLVPPTQRRRRLALASSLHMQQQQQQCFALRVVSPSPTSSVPLHASS
jgi:hypothetical protein